MDRFKDEFRNILMMITTHTNPIETDVDTLITPNSSNRSSCVTESSVRFKTPHESIEEGYLEYEYEVSSSSSYRSINSIHEMDLNPLKVIYDLRNIAERMIIAGYLNDCIHVYVSVRKPIIVASIHRIWIDKLDIGDVRGLEWDALEAKILRWIQDSKVCIRILLARETRLCEKIFEGECLDASVNDAFFMENVKDPTIKPFNFYEVISINPQPTEKLFRILDLLDALSDLLSDVDVICGSNSSERVRVQVAKIISSLAETARETLLKFASLVLHDQSKTLEPGGRIHPLTRCVMNYVIFVFDYRQTMVELFGLNPSMGLQIFDDPTTPGIDFPEPENQSSLAIHLQLIFRSLQIKLEDKSKYYKDASLSRIFLMNNVHYIVQKVEGSLELHNRIEDVYLRRLTLKYKQEITNYVTSTWIRILYCLRDEGLRVRWIFSFRISKSTLGKRLKTFNSKFEAAHRVQATWSVSDPQLQEELRISISEKLIPAYRSFLDRFRGRIEDEEHLERYIKYSVKDLEIAVMDLFEGLPISHHTRNRSQ